MEANNPLYFCTRAEFRQWLEKNYATENELWLIFPNKASGKPCLLYNDAVEEALSFGWIDSIIKNLDEENKVQRFTPRKNKNYYSQPNKERLKWLLENKLLHHSIEEEIREMLSKEFVFAPDIISKLQQDKTVWENYSHFPEGYKRIRIAYIDAARVRPEEFEKRLANFIKHTRAGKMMKGYGGVEKYYI